MNTIVECRECEALRSKIERLEEEANAAGDEMQELREEVRLLESERDAKRDDYECEMEEAINALLDEVQRPTGTLNFSLPVNSRSSAALSALFDVVNRNI